MDSKHTKRVCKVWCYCKGENFNNLRYTPSQLHVILNYQKELTCPPAFSPGSSSLTSESSSYAINTNYEDSPVQDN